MKYVKNIATLIFYHLLLTQIFKKSMDAVPVIGLIMFLWKQEYHCWESANITPTMTLPLGL